MRALLGMLGCVTLGLAWLGPLQRLAPGPFTGHMTMHMAVVAVASPLWAFALAGSGQDPVRRAAWLFPPLPISVLELIAVWAWHAPGPHHFARHSVLGLVLEQATFLVSGLGLWLAAFGGNAELRSVRAGQGALALLLTSMHMTLLGALLALPPRPLYAGHGHGHGHAALTPLEDQHLGGAVMLVVGGVVYLLGGLLLAVELLRARPARLGLERAR
ncbi:MAG: cytochrome c oxidase assembly protein [Polyangiales bacterium]